MTRSGRLNHTRLGHIFSGFLEAGQVQEQMQAPGMLRCHGGTHFGQLSPLNLFTREVHS